MAKNYYDITLAMAGISQAALMVQQLAHEGQCDREAFHTSLNSLLQMDPSSTLAVFGGEERNLKVGLETLMSVLNANNKGLGAELTRYTISLMESDTIISALAGIYVDVVSPLGPRIQVTGSPAILQNPQVQAKVRATLLAGIRAAVLWQQVGGSRLQLMFSRNRLFKQAQNIVAHC